MKKYLYPILIVLFISSNVFASPGDIELPDREIVNSYCTEIVLTCDESASINFGDITRLMYQAQSQNKATSHVPVCYNAIGRIIQNAHNERNSIIPNETLLLSQAPRTKDLDTQICPFFRDSECSDSAAYNILCKNGASVDPSCNGRGEGNGGPDSAHRDGGNGGPDSRSSSHECEVQRTHL